MATARLTAVVQTKGVRKSEQELKKFTKSANDADGKVKKLGTNFKSFGKNSAAAIASINGPLGGVSSRVSSLVTVLSSGTAAVTALALAVTGFGAAVIIGVKELDKINIGLKKSEALLKATGFAAGVTAGQLLDEARAIALNTLASVEGIQQASAVLLTFDRIQGDVRKGAVELSQDLATVFGGTAASQATQLGKALQDPIKGITALNRVGVSFTDTQKEQIRLFQEGGEQAKAQAIILEALQKQVGGAAAAVSAGTLAGALDEAGQRFAKLTENIAKTTGAYKAVIGILGFFNEKLKQVDNTFENSAIQDAITKGNNLRESYNSLNKEIERLNSSGIGSLPFGKQLVAQKELQAEQLKVAIDNNKKILADAQKSINEKSAAELAAQKKANEIAKKNREEDLALKARIEKEAADKIAKIKQARFDSDKARAQKELEGILALNDTELEAVKRKEAALLAKFSETNGAKLGLALEFEAARTEIEANGINQRELLKQAAFDKQLERTREENALAINASEVLASSAGDALLSIAKGQKTVKDAVLGTIQSVADAVVKSIIQQQIQQFVSKRIEGAAFLAAKTAEVGATVAQAGLNAFAATAAIPIVGPALAPGAAAVATGVATGLGSAVIGAAAAREQGGQFSSGQNILVGERGPEVVQFPSSGRVRNQTQLNQQDGNQAPSVSMVIIDQSEGKKEFDQSTDDNGSLVLLIRNVARETLSGDVADPNSQFSKNLGGATNTQRAGR